MDDYQEIYSGCTYLNYVAWIGL